MHRFSKLWYLAVLIALVKAQFNLFDQPLCQSIYITIFDDGSLPPETYVLSSETYQLATPPCFTYGPESPKIEVGTTTKLTSYSKFWDPPKVTTPPVVPTLPFANSLPQSQKPPPTPYITIPFPLLNRTTTKLAQTMTSTKVPVPAVLSEPVSEPAVVSTFQPLISTTLPSPATSSAAPIPLPTFPVCGSMLVPAGAFGLKEPAVTAVQIYHGSGYTENQDNPGNPGNNPPIVSSAYNMNLKTSVQEACLVVEMCVLFGFIHSLSSIDLHLVELSGDQVEWVCVGYPDIVGSGDFFTVQNTSVILAYGYDFPRPAISSVQIAIASATSSPIINTLFSSVISNPPPPLATGMSLEIATSSIAGFEVSSTHVSSSSSTPYLTTDMRSSMAPFAGLSTSTLVEIQKANPSLALLASAFSSAPAPIIVSSEKASALTLSPAPPLAPPPSSSSTATSSSAPEAIKPSSTESSLATSSPGLILTTNGFCGNGITCLGWTSGGIPAECCSQYGFCGSADIYCGANCQPEFGICGILSSSSSLPPVTPISTIKAPPQSPSPTSSSLPPVAPSSTVETPVLSSSPTSSSISAVVTASTVNAPAQSPSPTSVGCAAAPASPAQYNCGVSYVETGSYEFTWDQLFFGSCATENPNNPGNDKLSTAITKEFSTGDISSQLTAACTTLNACMDWAIPQAYDNVDFHLLQDSPTTAHWECVAYYDNAGGDYFDVKNNEVILAFGYDVE